MLGNIGESVLIGFLTVRAARGEFFSRIVNSLIMAFLTLNFLNRFSARSAKVVEVESNTDERVSRPETSGALVTERDSSTRHHRPATASAEDRQPTVGAPTLRPVRLLRSVIGTAF